jgi:hypothetical protein
MGGGGVQRPDWHGNEPKETGARSARARTSDQNPLVNYKRIEKLNMTYKGIVQRYV